MNKLLIFLAVIIVSHAQAQCLYVIRLGEGVFNNGEEVNFMDSIIPTKGSFLKVRSVASLVSNEGYITELKEGVYDVNDFFLETDKEPIMDFAQYRASLKGRYATKGAVTCGMPSITEIPTRSQLYRDSVFVSWNIPGHHNAGNDTTTYTIKLTNIFDEVIAIYHTNNKFFDCPVPETKEPYFLVKVGYSNGASFYEETIGVKTEKNEEKESIIATLIQKKAHPAILAMKCVELGFNLDALYYLHQLRDYELLKKMCLSGMDARN